MKRLLVTALLAVFLAAGCEESKPADEGPPPPPPKTEVKKTADGEETKTTVPD